jgi:hypothetical protein
MPIHAFLCSILILLATRIVLLRRAIAVQPTAVMFSPRPRARRARPLRRDFSPTFGVARDVGCPSEAVQRPLVGPRSIASACSAGTALP